MKSEVPAELTEEQLEIANQFKTEDALLDQMSGMATVNNRSERKKKLKFMKAELAKHVQRRPNVGHNPRVDVPQEIIDKKVAIMRAWATRYGILVRKIDELSNGSKRDSVRNGK